METIEDTNINSKLFPANEPPDHELYTIPSSSSWFSWDDIHETERIFLKEFFTTNSISKTPKIYKEYRDFIINKYREDPSRRLGFTEIRKSLIGDVSLIHKVFLFLEKWGLINFSVAGDAAVRGEERIVVVEEEDGRVVYEDGAPSGVRVVAFPNSGKGVTVPGSNVGGGEGVESGFRLPPLSSYSDVFRELMGKNGLSCDKCGLVCGSGKDESHNKKENIATCSRCLKNEKNENRKEVNDFKSKDSKDGSDNHGTDSWTEAETLLLLESLLLHGDNWDLVAQNVKTKSRSDCIAKLIQLPFGELMLRTTSGNGDGRNSNGNIINITEDQTTSLDPQKPIKKKDRCHNQLNESLQIEDGETEEPPQKRRCMSSFPDASGSLMKQVAHLSTVVSPHIAAASVEAAITALCEENPYARMILEGEGDNIAYMFGSPTSNNESKRLLNVENSELAERHTPSEETQDGITEKNSTSVTLRLRTAIATAFGAAAAHAKLLADQEDREVEHLVATVIETQLRKIQCKIKHFEELQLIMEKEYSQIQELKEYILSERIDVLQRRFNVRITRWRDDSSVKPYIGNAM